MKKVIIATTLVFLFLSIYSQPCLPEGITFTTQAQIDNFQANYPGCTMIEGDVTISGDDIINLQGLSVLTSLGSNLTICDNQVLSSLSGLGHHCGQECRKNTGRILACLLFASSANG